MAVTFDRHTALIVVDVQNDFAHPSGSLYVEGGDEIVPIVNRLIAEARAAGAMVVYTQDWHPPRTPHFVTDGGPWPVHCVRDTWGAQFHEDLDVDGHIIRKGTGGEDGYSGFTHRDHLTGEEKSTGLEELLRRHEIERVVVVGLAQDVCVKETALDAARLGFDTTLELTASKPIEVEPEHHRKIHRELADAGVSLHRPSHAQVDQPSEATQ